MTVHSTHLFPSIYCQTLAMKIRTMINTRHTEKSIGISISLSHWLAINFRDDRKSLQLLAGRKSLFPSTRKKKNVQHCQIEMCHKKFIFLVISSFSFSFLAVLNIYRDSIFLLNLFFVAIDFLLEKNGEN